MIVPMHLVINISFSVEAVYQFYSALICGGNGTHSPKLQPLVGFLCSFYLEKCQTYSYLFSPRLEKATVGHLEKYTSQSLVVTRSDKPKPTDGCVCVYRQQQGEEDVCGREEAAVQWS